MGSLHALSAAVTVTLQKSGRVLVNDTLQMTADTKLSLVSGNTRADFTPSSAKFAVGGSVVEISPAAVKVSTGGASIEMSAGQINITAQMVSLNNGALTVV